ncbi:MAG TPA: hypothetical protein GX506_01025 [Firmicutes bacterium]|nr:hypothetical protein [Bacillota bacterium]
MHDKQELREMSRIETLRVAGELLETYRRRKASGQIIVDIRNGKPIWVKPVIADPAEYLEATGQGKTLHDLDSALRQFQAMGKSGTVTLLVYEGRVVDMVKVVELEKVRVG